MLLITSLLVLGYTQSVLCSASLTLPDVSNCGDTALLTCTSINCSVGYTFSKDDATILNKGGPVNASYVNKYFGTEISNSQAQLTIMNIELSDTGKYFCDCSFDLPSPRNTLQYQCEARISTPSVTERKQLIITVDRLYPKPSSIDITLNSLTNQLPGMFKCWYNSTSPSHSMCTWVSTASLQDGNHSYTMTITTSTPVTLSGSFRIATPTSPNISNLVVISTDRRVLTGKQDTPLTIQCVSRGGIPAPSLAWYRGNTSTSPLAPSNLPESIKQSDGTYTVTLSHSFTPRRTDDLTPFLCRLFYPGDPVGVTPNPKPALADLYLDLKPDSPTVSQTGEAISGGNMTLRCTSTNGRPAPTIRWLYRNQTISPTIESRLDLTSETYTVESVLQRPVYAVDNGQTATCVVSHTTLSSPLNASINVVVKYPPTMYVSTTASPPTYTITCKAEGYPENYTYQDWVQIWPGYGPVATIPFNGTILTLTDVTYERNGVYVCAASNGVAVYGEDVTFAKGNVSIAIKAPPVLTDPSPGGKKVPVTGILGQNATTEIKYWSNVNGSVVRCYKVEDSHQDIPCSVTETPTNVTLPVFNHNVTETGSLATIKIPIHLPEDFADYDIVVSNNVQEDPFLGITIVERVPPTTPTIMGNFSITPGHVILTVVPGFHGGYNQTLVVQISTDLKTWSNKTSVNTGLDNGPIDVHLVDLQGSTLHYIRVFAYNRDGKSDLSSHLNFTTIEGMSVSAGQSSLALISGVVAGVCVPLMIGVSLFIIWRLRRGTGKRSRTQDTRHTTTNSEHSDTVVECAMYVSAGVVQSGPSMGDFYSKPQKKDRPQVSSDMYAVVNKTKKDVYENAPESLKNGDKKFPQKPKAAKRLAASGPKKNISTDGLFYAELEFTNNPKISTIHGLDNATTYVQVDFTKAADPLPDSDEETSAEK